MTAPEATPTTKPTEAPREQWSGQLGFILAAIGSAVGLGNIWRFPGVAYENGGGAFLIPYLVALLTAGIPILWLDYSIGHRFRGAAPTAFRRLFRPGESLGWFQVAISFVITLYYAVILAWALAYMWFSLDLAWGDDPAGFLFGDYLQVPDGVSVGFDVVPGVLLPLVLVWAGALAILAFGVKRGLERANFVMIPLLGIMFGALVVRALTLEGAVDGLNAFFTPDWDALSNPSVWIAAYSQIFFSLSIAFGIMVTYSSYLRRRANLTSTGLVVGFANSSFELLAGIGVFSALGFMAAQNGTTVAELDTIQGIGLAFVAFPQILSTMPGGPAFGVVFFGSLVLAGLTSLLSILQVVSAAFQEKFGLSPRRGALTVGGICAVLSIGLYSTTTAVPLLDTADHYVNNIGVVASAIAMTVLIAWGLRRLPELQGHLNNRTGLDAGRWWRVLITVVVPVVLGYMFVSASVTLIREGYGGYPAWFTTTFGWLMIVAMLVAAVVFSLLRWRRDPDAFVPESLPTPYGALEEVD
jgi:NSS family neurotransmitter:Na+ symporter